MSEGDFQQLLDAMPKIAESMKDLPAELRERAFEAFLSSIKGTTIPSQAIHSRAPISSRDGYESVSRVPAKKAPAKRAAGGKAKQSFSLDKTLDLVNGGSPSFKEFWESKKPTSVLEKCLVSVYWLTYHTRNAVPVTVDQVYTCFKAANWALPNDLINTLQQAGTRGWLDTKKRDDLKVVIHGENHVEHNMPAKAKGA